MKSIHSVGYSGHKLHFETLYSSPGLNHQLSWQICVCVHVQERDETLVKALGELSLTYNLPCVCMSCVPLNILLQKQLHREQCTVRLTDTKKEYIILTVTVYAFKGPELIQTLTYCIIVFLKNKAASRFFILYIV